MFYPTMMGYLLVTMALVAGADALSQRSPATLFTPHLGSAVWQARQVIEARVAANIADMLAGRRLRDPVVSSSAQHFWRAGVFLWRHDPREVRENILLGWVPGRHGPDCKGQ